MTTNKAIADYQVVHKLRRKYCSFKLRTPSAFQWHESVSRFYVCWFQCTGYYIEVRLERNIKDKNERIITCGSMITAHSTFREM
jgi:hypothetical protein